MFNTLDGGGIAERLLLPENLVGKRRSFRPIMVLFFGRRGAGKTLALTTTMRFQDRRNKTAKYPCSVTTNYHVAFAEHQDPHILDELLEFPVWARNLYLGIDEIGSCFAGRRSLASINLLFSQLAGQIRKLATEIGATTRFPQVLDQQHIMEIDLFIRCEQFFFTTETGQPVKDAQGNPRQGVDLDIWDYWGQWTGDMRRKYWPPYLEPVDGEKRFINTQYIWPLYRTDEVIAPMFSKARENIIGRSWDMVKESPEDTKAEDLEPKTLEDHLALIPGTFNIASKLQVASRFYSGITSKRKFAEWLTENGYDVEGENGNFWAKRKPEASSPFPTSSDLPLPRPSYMDIDEAIRQSSKGKA